MRKLKFGIFPGYFFFICISSKRDSWDMRFDEINSLDTKNWFLKKGLVA